MDGEKEGARSLIQSKVIHFLCSDEQCVLLAPPGHRCSSERFPRCPVYKAEAEKHVVTMGSSLLELLPPLDKLGALDSVLLLYLNCAVDPNGSSSSCCRFSQMAICRLRSSRNSNTTLSVITAVTVALVVPNTCDIAGSNKAVVIRVIQTMSMIILVARLVSSSSIPVPI